MLFSPFWLLAIGVGVVKFLIGVYLPLVVIISMLSSSLSPVIFIVATNFTLKNSKHLAESAHDGEMESNEGKTTQWLWPGHNSKEARHFYLSPLLLASTSLLLHLVAGCGASLMDSLGGAHWSWTFTLYSALLNFQYCYFHIIANYKSLIPSST